MNVIKMKLTSNGETEHHRDFFLSKECLQYWDWFTFYWVIDQRGPMYIHKRILAITEAIGCSTQTDNKALLMKKIPTILSEHGKAMLVPSRAFISKG